MNQYWDVEYQISPPDMHRRNSDERDILTFKVHFVSILAGVASNFPSHLWDILLPQAKLTLNLLLQASDNPKLSAWAYSNSTFNYDGTPLGPLGCKVVIHKNRGVTLVGLSWQKRLVCRHVT